jgi:hypothetical protein
VPLVLGDLAGAGLGGATQLLELGVALRGLLLGCPLELRLGGVLERLPLGVAADRPLARVTDETDGIGPGQGRAAGGHLDRAGTHRLAVHRDGAGTGQDESGDADQGGSGGKTCRQPEEQPGAQCARRLLGLATASRDRGLRCDRSLPAAVLSPVLSHARSSSVVRGVCCDPPR